MVDIKILNREKILAKLAKLPKAMIEAADQQVKNEAEDLAAAVRRAVPVLTGVLRETIRVEASDRPLTYVVKAGGVPATRKRVRRGVADADFARAKAEGGFQGEYDYALAVEFGHRTVEGEHVPAEPFFFPTYRARKKAMRRRVKAAAKKAMVAGGFDLDRTRG